ncbi:hypothetical protein TFLX_05576 [Thermoflexales bacterium]|nr:hypothetical protein TFLX_05576 [Thermoflexales bacterium]
MLIDGLALDVVLFVGVFLRQVFQHFLKGDEHGGAGLLPAAPFEHEAFGFQGVEELLCEALHLLTFLLGEFGAGPREDVEDRQLLVVQLLADAAPFFFVQLLRKVNELGKQRFALVAPAL